MGSKVIGSIGIDMIKIELNKAVFEMTLFIFFSSRRRHTRSGRVTGVQTCVFRSRAHVGGLGTKLGELKVFGEGNLLDAREPRTDELRDRKSVV